MENKKTEFYKAFSKLQETIKVKKENRNTYGKYNYRTLEDISAEVKKHLNGLILYLSDEVVMVGTRFYLKATATITDGDCSVSNSAYAREECFTETNNTKATPGQITGGASSYARKYALSGLFLLENEKDDDALNQTTSKHSTTSKPTKAPTFSAKPASDNQKLKEERHKLVEEATMMEEKGFNYSSSLVHDEIEKIDKIVEKEKSPTTKYPPKLASDKQKSFLSKLNVQFNANITSKEASKLIEKNMNKPPSKKPNSDAAHDEYIQIIANIDSFSGSEEEFMPFMRMIKNQVSSETFLKEIYQAGELKLSKIKSEKHA